MQTGLCPWCQKEVEDLHHLWWVCEAHERQRAKVRELLPGGPNSIPRSLALHGLPVEPSGDMMGPVWREVDCPEHKTPDQHEWELQGDARIAWNQTTERILEAMGTQSQPVTLEALTVRQVGMWTHDGYATLPTWKHRHVHSQRQAK